MPPAVRARWRGRRHCPARPRPPAAPPRPVSVTLTTSAAPSRSRDDADRAAVGGRFDAMLDRVLDQRDQQVRRKRMLRQVGRHVDVEREPRAHPHLEDVEVRGGEADFLAQRRRARAQLRQRGAQVVDQVRQQPAGLARIRFRQVLDGRQRVEQEVRLDLRLHEFQFGLDRVLRHQVALGFGHVQRGGRMRFAELEQEDEAHAQAHDEPGERRAEDTGSDACALRRSGNSARRRRSP